MTFALLDQVRADDHPVIDDDELELPHGTFVLETKEKVPRIIVVDDPWKTVVLRKVGSTVEEDQVTNSFDRMDELEKASRDTFAIYRLGQQDPFLQHHQRADLGSSETRSDFSNVSIASSASSSTPDLNPSSFVPLSIVPVATNSTALPDYQPPILVPVLAPILVPVLAPVQVPHLSGVMLAIDTGSSSSDYITNVGTLVVSGLAAGATPQYSIDGGATWTGSFTAVEGANSILVRQVDSAGNVSAALPFSFILDTVAPGAPTIVSVKENPVINASEASDGTPVVVDLTGTGAMAGDTLTIHWGSQTVTYTLLASDITAGSATVIVSAATIAAQGDGTVDVTAQLADVAGNVGGDSATLTLTVDTVAPAAPGVALATDSGSSNGDLLTNHGTLALSGIEAGATVEYSIDGGTTWTSAFSAIEGGNTVLVRQTDVAGNVSSPSTLNFVLDTANPTLTVDIVATSLSDGTPSSTVNFTFSEAPVDFTAGDIIATHGTISNFTMVDATHYTATFTATDDFSGNGSVTVGAGSYTDAAGNSGGAGSDSVAIDTANPTLTVDIVATSLSDGTPSSTVNFTFSEAPVDFTAGDIIATHGTISNFTMVDATHYTATFTATDDFSGNGSVTVGAGSYTDAAGNSGGAGSDSVAIDTANPTLTVDIVATSLSDGTPSSTVNFTFSEAPVDFTAGDIIATHGTISNFTMVDATHYTATFTATDDFSGNGSVTVGAGSYTDAAGNSGGAGSDSVAIDTANPTLTVDIVATSLSDGTPSSTVNFTFSEAPVDFTAGDIIATHGTISNFTMVDATHYTATFTATDDFSGNGSVTVGAGSYTDAAGNSGGAGSDSVAIDTANPTLTVDIVATSLSDGTPSSTVNFTFSEAPVDFTAGDIIATHGTISNFTMVDATHYTATFTATDDFSGNGSVTVGAGSYTDAAGNSGGAGSDSVAIDTANPTLTVDIVATSLSDGTPSSTVNFTFSEAPVDFTAGDIIATHGTISNFTMVDATHYTATFTATDDFSGNGSVTVGAGSYTDAAGNSGGAGSDSVAIDTANPTLTVDIVATSLSDGTPSSTVNFTFSEAPVDFTAGDIIATHGTISNFTMVDATHYTATFTATDDFSGNGSVTVGAGSYTDAAGNSGGAGSDSVAIDTANPTLTVDIVATSLSDGTPSSTVNFTFSEAPVDFTAGDIIATHGTISNFTMVDATHYTATFTATDDFSGNGSVTVGAGSYTDAAGNSGGAGSDSVAIDTAGDPNDFDYLATGDPDGHTIQTDPPYIYGTPDADTIDGNNQKQTIYGGVGDDTITGDNASETIYGGSGNDQLFGNRGADTIYGGSGNDIIDGGMGPDTIVGGYGADTLTGGESGDAFRYLSLADSGDHITDFNTNLDVLEFTVTAGRFVIGDGDTTVENVRAGNDAAINLTGTEVGIKTDTDVTTATVRSTIDSYNNITTGALFVFYNSTVGHAQVYYDPNPSVAGGAILVADLDNLTTLASITGTFSAANFAFGTALAPAGVSGQPINLGLTAEPANQGQTATVVVGNMPAGWALNGGTQLPDGSWTIQTTDVSSLTITPPIDFQGAMHLDVTVSWAQPDGSLMVATFADNVEAYAPGNPIFAISGDDHLTGSSGQDLFVFAQPIGYDVIYNFDASQDQIDLIGYAGFANFDDVQSHLTTDANDNAVITLADGQSITLFGVAADSLSASDFVFDQTPVTNNTGTMTIGDGALLPLSGIVNNTGTIALDSAGSTTTLELIQHGITLEGGGRLTLSDSDQNFISSATAGVTLTNVDNTISGAGQIGDWQMTLVNSGTIIANGTHALLIDTGPNVVTNSGTLEATGSGGLIVNSDIANSGLIWADGGNITINGAVTGTGSALISGASTLEFGAASSINVTFVDDDGFGTLALDNPTAYTGQIFGFTGTDLENSDIIDLKGITFDDAGTSWTYYDDSGSNTGGILTIYETSFGVTTAVVSITFGDGEYTSDNFILTSDGNGGTLIADPPADFGIATTEFDETSEIATIGQVSESDAISAIVASGAYPLGILIAAAASSNSLSVVSTVLHELATWFDLPINELAAYKPTETVSVASESWASALSSLAENSGLPENLPALHSVLADFVHHDANAPRHSAGVQLLNLLDDVFQQASIGLPFPQTTDELNSHQPTTASADAALPHFGENLGPLADLGSAVYKADLLGSEAAGLHAVTHGSFLGAAALDSFGHQAASTHIAAAEELMSSALNGRAGDIGSFALSLANDQFDFDHLGTNNHGNDPQLLQWPSEKVAHAPSEVPLAAPTPASNLALSEDCQIDSFGHHTASTHIGAAEELLSSVPNEKSGGTALFAFDLASDQFEFAHLDTNHPLTQLQSVQWPPETDPHVTCEAPAATFGIDNLGGLHDLDSGTLVTNNADPVSNQACGPFVFNAAFAQNSTNGLETAQTSALADQTVFHSVADVLADAAQAAPEAVVPIAETVAQITDLHHHKLLPDLLLHG